MAIRRCCEIKMHGEFAAERCPGCCPGCYPTWQERRRAARIGLMIGLVIWLVVTMPLFGYLRYLDGGLPALTLAIITNLLIIVVTYTSLSLVVRWCYRQPRS